MKVQRLVHAVLVCVLSGVFSFSIYAQSNPQRIAAQPVIKIAPVAVSLIDSEPVTNGISVVITDTECCLMLTHKWGTAMAEYVDLSELDSYQVQQGYQIIRIADFDADPGIYIIEASGLQYIAVISSYGVDLDFHGVNHWPRGVLSYPIDLIEGNGLEQLQHFSPIAFNLIEITQINSYEFPLGTSVFDFGESSYNVFVSYSGINVRGMSDFIAPLQVETEGVKND